MDESLKEQILALAAAELRRMGRNEEIELSLVDGDNFKGRLGMLYDVQNSIPADFPKGHWIVYLRYSNRGEIGPSTIMAFAKKSLEMVYFGSANDEG